MINARYSAALSLALVFALPAVGHTQQLARLGGEGIYARFCASCHGADGRGDGPVAASLAVPVSDLTRLSHDHDGRFPAEYVRRVIEGRSPGISAHGPRHMPVWGWEFWLEEGASVEAEAHVDEAIEMLVGLLRFIQRPLPAGSGAD